MYRVGEDDPGTDPPVGWPNGENPSVAIPSAVIVTTDSGASATMAVRSTTFTAWVTVVEVVVAVAGVTVAPGVVCRHEDDGGRRCQRRGEERRRRGSPRTGHRAPNVGGLAAAGAGFAARQPGFRDIRRGEVAIGAGLRVGAGGWLVHRGGSWRVHHRPVKPCPPETDVRTPPLAWPAGRYWCDADGSLRRLSGLPRARDRASRAPGADGCRMSTGILHHFSRPEIVIGQGYPPPADRAAAQAELADLRPRSASVPGTASAGGSSSATTRRSSVPPGCTSGSTNRSARPSSATTWSPRRGVGGTCARPSSAILDFAFGPMRLERVEAFVLTSNERSQRVLDRLGFRRVALLPDHGEDEHGTLRDEWLFGLSHDDWSEPGVPAAAGGGRRRRPSDLAGATRYDRPGRREAHRSAPAGGPGRRPGRWRPPVPASAGSADRTTADVHSEHLLLLGSAGR